MSATAAYPHLTIDADGRARIEGTRYAVEHLAAEHYCYGWSAEELLAQHPDLRPEQVYAALTYFYDHFDALVVRFHEVAAATDDPRRRQPLTRAELLLRKSVAGGNS